MGTDLQKTRSFGLSALLNSLHNRIQTVNDSKIFAGIMIITLNIVSRFVSIKVSKTMEAYLKYTFSKYLLVFTIAWMGTRDIYIALIVLACFIVMIEFLFDEESMFYILPEEFKDYHISMLEDGENEEVVSDEDIKKAEKTLERAKKQNKKKDFESYVMK